MKFSKIMLGDKNSRKGFAIAVSISLVSITFGIFLIINLSPDVTAWSGYNLYYRPLYFFVPNGEYQTFYISLVSGGLILIISLLLCFFLVRIRSLFDHRKAYTFFCLVPISIILVTNYLLNKDLCLDMNSFFDRKFEIFQTDIIHVEKNLHSSRKGKHYRYEIQDKDISE